MEKIQKSIKDKRTLFREKVEKNQCEVISAMGAIDLFMTSIISNYSAKPKQVTIMQYLLRNTSIHNKIELLDYILKEDKKLNKLSYDNLFPDIKSVQKIRNQYAHSLIVIPTDIPDEKLNYFEFKSFLELSPKKDLKIVKNMINSHNGTMKLARNIMSALTKINGSIQNGKPI